MSKASAVITQVHENLPATAELPLSAFDIKVTRLEKSAVKIQLSRGAVKFEVTGKYGKRIKIDNFMAHVTIGKNPYMIAMCPDFWILSAPTMFRVEQKSADATLDWRPEDEEYSATPSQESIKKLDRAIIDVAERILTRFSRVDLL